MTVKWKNIEKFGVVLRGLRHREGLTQSQLYDLTGINEKTISKMENGKLIISREYANRLAEVLNCKPELFFECNL